MSPANDGTRSGLQNQLNRYVVCVQAKRGGSNDPTADSYELSLFLQCNWTVSRNMSSKSMLADISDSLTFYPASGDWVITPVLS